MERKLRVIITSGPLDKDYLEAEVWFGNEQWALLTNFSKTIKFFSKGGSEPWVFEFEDVLAIFARLANEDLDVTLGLDDNTK